MPSAKALGKRKAANQDEAAVASNKKQTKLPGTSKTTNVIERRITRGESAWAGTTASAVDAASPGPSSAPAQDVPSYENVVFLLTLDDKRPEDYDPPFVLHEAQEMTEDMKSTLNPRIPTWELIEETPRKPKSRSKRQSQDLETFDDSDAVYAKRHRGPEILEKRAKKQELSFLSQERTQLRTLLDKVRNPSVENLDLLNQLRTMLKSETIIQLQVVEGMSLDEQRAARIREVERVKRLLIAEGQELLAKYEDLLDPNSGSTNGALGTLHKNPATGDQVKRASPAPATLPLPKKRKADAIVEENKAERKRKRPSTAATSSLKITIKAKKPSNQAPAVPITKRPQRTVAQQLKPNANVDVSEEESEDDFDASILTPNVNASSSPGSLTSLSSPAQPDKITNPITFSSFYPSTSSSNAPKPRTGRRQSGRHAQAFGVKVPEALIVEKEFDLIGTQFSADGPLGSGAHGEYALLALRDACIEE